MKPGGDVDGSVDWNCGDRVHDARHEIPPRESSFGEPPVCLERVLNGGGEGDLKPDGVKVQRIDEKRSHMIFLGRIGKL